MKGIVRRNLRMSTHYHRNHHRNHAWDYLFFTGTTFVMTVTDFGKSWINFHVKFYGEDIRLIDSMIDGILNILGD